MSFNPCDTPAVWIRSIPPYVSSIYSPTIINSTLSNRVLTSSKDFAGRILEYNSSDFQSVTFTDLCPLPTGVVVGPFRATSYF